MIFAVYVPEGRCDFNVRRKSLQGIITLVKGKSAIGFDKSCQTCQPCVQQVCYKFAKDGWQCHGERRAEKGQRGLELETANVQGCIPLHCMSFARASEPNFVTPTLLQHGRMPLRRKSNSSEAGQQLAEKLPRRKIHCLSQPLVWKKQIHPKDHCRSVAAKAHSQFIVT